jgi:hypothetical protein
MSRPSPVKTGWRKHFEGWQVALVLTVCAAVPSVLAIPHATVSREIPLPSIDRAEQRRVAQRDRALAEEARLPYETRASGDAFRRYGALRARGVQTAAQWILNDVQQAVRTAQSDQMLKPLLQLRAVQTQLFITATDRLRIASPPDSDPDVLELGGEFMKEARAAGWLGPRGLQATVDELRTWFVIRWNTLTQLTQEPLFAASLNEWRCYYAFLLRDDHEPPDVPWGDVLSYKARVLGALAAKDPDYPINLAQGLLSCQAGDYTTCSELLTQHLRRSPNGPWTLRAQATLKVAAAALRSQRR